PHEGLRKFVKSLNHLYSMSPALYEKSFECTGFEWIDNMDHANSVVVFIRKGNDPASQLVIAMNMTPVPRHDYRIGLPMDGIWIEVLNSDDVEFYGSGVKNQTLTAQPIPWQHRQQSVAASLPPLG